MRKDLSVASAQSAVNRSLISPMVKIDVLNISDHTTGSAYEDTRVSAMN